MFGQSWRLIKRLTGGLVIFLGVLGLVEVLRAGLFLYRLSPWAAAIFGALMLVGLLYLGGEWRRLPQVLQPPREPLSPAADIRVWLRYARYLARYLERLALNPNLDAAARAQALAAAAGLREVLAHHPLRADLEREIARAEQETVTPLLAGLRRTAEAEVRRCVRDVMLGVTLSPYHSIDLLIVLYRNGAMVLRVSRIFASRPRAREEWLIVRDVIRVMAAVNLFHVSRMIFERLFTSVPLLGGSMQDIGQGLGAGLLTSAAGHAAIERCAAFRGWNRAEAVVNLAGQARRFFGDVRRIFTTDILPELKPRLRSEARAEGGAADEQETARLLERVSSAVGQGIDAGLEALNRYVAQPTATSVRLAVQTGAQVGQDAVRFSGLGLSRFWRALGHPFRRRNP